MNKLNIYIVIFCLLALTGFAQRNSEKGDKYFYQNQFTEAAKYYVLDAKSKNKKVAEHAMLRLADCYRISGEFEKAEAAYKKFLKKFKKNPLSYLNYGLSLKSSAKYAEAKVQFEEYIKMNPTDQMGSVYLQSCDSAQLWLDETMGKEVKNIAQINTNESEFAPYILNNKLFFSSSREGSKAALISFDGGGNINRMDIYATDYSNLLSSKIEKKKIVNQKAINTAAHEGTPTFSADGMEVYFSRTVKGKRDNRSNDILNTLQVFYSKKDSLGNWTTPVSAFDFNSNAYSVCQPALSIDGNTIYFMSDMPGGFGKTDIYCSVKTEKGTWSMPKNLGQKINTFGHEVFPYMSNDGRLYFSSTGHPGMGQLDIFYSEKTLNEWSAPKNLKPPYNSIGNDFGICFDETNLRGFLSSDRFNGLGAEDIYSFSNDGPVNFVLSNDSVTIFNSFVYDDVKYKFENTTDSTVIELDFSKEYISIKLENNKAYILTAKKNGMSINKMLLSRNLDSTLNTLQFSIVSELLDAKIEYQFANKSNEKNGVLINDSNGAQLEFIETIDAGKVRPITTIKAGETYFVLPITNTLNKEVKKKDISN